MGVLDLPTSRSCILDLFIGAKNHLFSIIHRRACASFRVVVRTSQEEHRYYNEYQDLMNNGNVPRSCCRLKHAPVLIVSNVVFIGTCRVLSECPEDERFRDRSYRRQQSACAFKNKPIYLMKNVFLTRIVDLPNNARNFGVNRVPAVVGETTGFESIRHLE